ncbi:unnamed protein product [Rhizophagus irregularis]|nr:unnamed protein product [Rhizophagus irregularis]
MVKQVLCTCIWCLQESNGQGKSVSKATRARHIIKQKKTWANPAGMPTLQRHITTPISQTTSAVSPSTVMLLPTNTTEEISNYNHGEDINIDFFENMMSDRNEEIISERSSSDEEDQIEVLEYEENEKDNDDEYDGDDDNDDDNDEGDDNNNNNEGDDKGNNEEEENNKEYNGEISEDLIKGLRLLKIKDKYNIPEAAFNEILKVFEISKVSLFKLRKLLGNIVPLEPTLVNCCINSCVAFTGEFINEDHCPYCGEFRYKSSQVARKNASYWSLINTLRAQYKDKARSETLRYRHTYTSTNERYDPENLPLRTHEGYIQDVMAIEHVNGTLYRQEVQKRGFKAEDWTNWVILYSLPLLQNYLPERYLNGWAKFVHAVKLCLKKNISISELTEIDRLFREFVTHYEREYIQDDSRRFSAALISYHYLLHISTSIRNTGPAWATWQYPMERLCGMLVPLVHSKQHPYTNLRNQITIWTQFSHLQYKAEVNQKVFGNKLRELSTIEEELYSLSRKYCMNRTELQRLRAYYVTVLNKPADQLMPITDSIQKYGKFRTKYGLIINSKLSNRKGDVARKNFCIAVKLLVDKNAHRPNAPIILEEREFFGEVQYFFSHQYNGCWSMLAYVQWVRNPRPSGHGPLKFRDLGAFEVINISAIDRNVGFLKMPNNELYIIDRENRVKFR